MRISEQTIVGKESAAKCEDGIAVTDDFVAVVDGSTSKTLFRLAPDMSNGQYAMRAIIGFICGADTFNCGADGDVAEPLAADADVETFCDCVTSRLRAEYERRDIASRLADCPEDRPCASCAIYSRARREVWMVGDCQVMVDGVVYDNPKPYEADIASQRARLIAGGMSPADARRAIEPFLVKAMREGQNKRYAVVDGFPIWMQGVRALRVDEGAEVALATDGYPFLCPTLAESEEALARQLQTDPQNISSFIATKGLKPGLQSFDDRAYIRFQV